MNDNQQIPLSFQVRRNDNFEQFVVGNNQLAFTTIRGFLESVDPGVGAQARANSVRSLYLKGDSGCGKTLLLNAICNQAREKGLIAIYLPLKHLIKQGGSPPADIQGVEVLCVDDIDALSGNPAWEEAVFHYFNQIRAHSGHVISAGRQGPEHLSVGLPDLRSRLAWGEVHGLKVLADKDKKIVLQEHARRQGVEVAEEVINYLLKYGRRDLKSLLSVLDDLQQTAFAEKRTPSVPLLRNILKNHI